MNRWPMSVDRVKGALNQAIFVTEMNRRVVLIEDNAAHAKLVERLLGRSAGFVLEWFERLATGLPRLQAGGVDVVLLDLGLPDCERHETLGRVLAVAPDVPVIVLTTAEDLDAAIRSVQQGAQDDLPKSQLSRELLIRSIRYAIERKQAEQRVRESERLYRAIGESMDFGAWVCDAEGKNIYASPSFLQLTGLTQEQCSGVGWGEALHPDDLEDTLRAWRRCVRAGKFWDRQHRILGVDGEYHPVLARGVPVYDERGRITCWAGFNLDISDLKRAEEELKSLNATLEQRVAARSAEAEERAAKLRLLASDLSETESRERGRLAQALHDNLQQILVAAKMRTDVLAARVNDDRAKQMLGQVTQLLSQSIDEARSLTLDLSPPVLRDRGLGAALEWLARRTREQHHLDVAVEIVGDAEHVSEGAAVFLFQAARELIFNIVKHAGVATAAVRLDCGSGGIELIVKDEGAGFDPEILDGSARASEHFGLFSIRERIELMGGGLRVRSAGGTGTSVTLHMPYGGAAASPGAAGAAPREAAPGRPAAGAPTVNGDAKIRVVLVDDHRVVREGIASLLSAEPDIAVVGEADCGQDAMRLLEAAPPDAVLMDVGLPGPSGVEVTQWIRERWPHVRVIGLSMHDPADFEPAMRAAGAVGYFSKAGPADLLLNAIRAAAATETAG